MNLKRFQKLIIIIGIILVVLILENIKKPLLVIIKNHLNTNCIYDPVHQLIKPINFFLHKNNIVLRIMTAIDGLLIEFCFFSLGILWVKNGNSSSLVPAIMFFYIFRSFCMSASKWPQPPGYIFSNPGIPNFFISYKNTNDLYFSGHSGGLMVLLLEVVYYSRKGFMFLLFPLLFYTVFILLVENMHYLNDIIIGLAAGFLISRIIYYYKKNYTVILFKIYIKIGILLQYLINLKTSEIIEKFKSPKKNKKPKLTRQSSQDFNLNTSN